MMQSSENKEFNASDIERYHAGQMSAAERHALEKAALDDPFLADALEGYAFTATPAQDLQKLRERLLGASETERKTVVIPARRWGWMRAAAIILVVAGSSWLAYSLFTPSARDLAQEPVTKVPERVQKSSTPARQPSIPKEEFQLKDSEPVIVMNPPRFKNTGSDYHFSVPAEDKPSAELNEVAMERPVRVDTAQTLDLAAANARGYNTERAPNYKLNNQAAGRNNDEMLRGRVAGVNVTNNNSQSRRQSAENIYRMEGDSLGFRDQVAYRKEASDTIRNFNVVLNPAALPQNEVVVLNPDAKKALPSRELRVIIDTLEPAEGVARFDDYIASNLKTPDEIKTKQLAGEVQLSFEVDKNGQPTNITVLKSLCNQCDEEAIRLLKEGPKWKKKKNQKGKITIKF